MLLLRSLLFNLFLYTGIVVVFLIALPTLFLPSKFTLFFGKLLGHYVIFVVKIFLNTQVEIKGTDNIPKAEKYYNECLSIPLFPGIRTSEAEYIVKTLNSIIN